MLNIKVTDEMAKRLNLTSADDFTPRMEALLASETGLQTKAALQTDQLREMAASISEIRAKVDGLPTVDAAALTKSATEAAVTAARIEAAQTATSIYGKSGNPPAGDTELKDQTKSKDSAPAADDYPAQYKANKNLQDEFMTEKAYVKFMEMNASGRVKISRGNNN